MAGGGPCAAFFAHCIPCSVVCAVANFMLQGFMLGPNLWRVHKRIWLARSLLTGTNFKVLAFHLWCSEPKCSFVVCGLLVLACSCLCRLHFVLLPLLGQGGVLPFALAIVPWKFSPPTHPRKPRSARFGKMAAHGMGSTTISYGMRLAHVQLSSPIAYHALLFVLMPISCCRGLC